MRNLILLPAAVLAAALLTTAVNADPPGPGGPAPDGQGWHHEHHGHDHCGHHHGGGMMMKELKLTDAQKVSIKGFFESSRGQLKAQFEAVHKQRRALETATPGSPEFQSAATALAQAESAAASARVQQRAALATQIYGVLTSAQKSQWAKLRAERLAKMDAWRAKHHDHEHGHEGGDDQESPPPPPAN